MENIVNYVLIGIVVLMLIALPIMMNSKNKKENAASVSAAGKTVSAYASRPISTINSRQHGR